MARLFFGVSLPTSVREDLDELAEGISGARWVPEENYHVTLSFLGEVPERQIAEVDDAARSVRADGFSLSLESVGVFPRKPPARVLWAGIRPEPLLLRLQKRLERELSEIGFLPEKRKFHPHVTLARLGKDESREQVSDWVARHLSLRSDPFIVTRFQLLSSVQAAGGSEYRVLGTYALHR